MIRKTPWSAAVGLLLALSLLSVATAQARLPEIVVSPSEVAPGRSVTVYGFGFCPTTSCDRVSIFVDTDLVSSDVQVNDENGEGVFQFSFEVDQDPGDHNVRAFQELNDGSTLEVIYPLVVVNVTPSPVAGTPEPAGSATQAPGGTGAASPTPATSPGEDGGETPSSGDQSPGASPRPGETRGSTSPTRAVSGQESEGDDDGSTVLWVAIAVALSAAALAAGAFVVLRRRR